MSIAGLELKQGGGTLRLAGQLDFGNAAVAFTSVQHQLQSGIVELDLGGLTNADSAALACLLAWRAESNHAGRTLNLVAIPENLRALAQVSDVLQLLDAPQRAGGG